MITSVPSASNNISESIAKLRLLSRVEVQSGWRYSDCDSAVDYVNICNWQVAELNEKGHIAWPSGKQVLHLGQQFVIPSNLHGYPVTGLRLLLGLTWWAEDAQIFVNGELVGQGDLFDCSDRVLLTDSAIPGDEFLVILRLVSPGHDSGALVRSICLYESADSACLDPGFVADELEILQNFLTRNLANLKFPYSSTEIVAHQGFLVKREMLKSEIAREVGLIDWSVLCDRQRFDLSLAVLRQNLLGCLRDVPRDLKDGTTESAESAEGRENHPVFVIGDGGEKLSTSIYIGEIYLLGHAHLDLAWLWPIEETWLAAERTFESVLKLQSEFPYLIFCHSTPALYAWIEEHRPDLFTAIKKQVAAGLWEVVGGLWVEPDLNLISAESMVRQVFYGQRYSQEKFGELMRVVWLPDTFGFGWQLPQILRAGGLDYFVTQKLQWNDTTEFPHSVFLWEGLDGTKIFSMMSAAIGEGIESVKMANYTFDWQFKTGLQSAFWLPGVGDHGGGPTRDMLEVAKRWEMSPFFPSLQFAKAVDYLSLIESQFLPEISESESAGAAVNQENKPILKLDEVVENLSAIEADNFNKISDSESAGAAVTWKNQPILKQDEVVGNLSEFESPKFTEISESDSAGAAVTWKNKPILKQDEVVENLSAVEADNFNEISDSESAGAAVTWKNQPILKQDEVVENLSAIESPKFTEISESDSAGAAVTWKNQPILKQDEVVGNLSAIEAGNFNEISDSESAGAALTWKNQPILKQDEVVENLSAVEADNFNEISDSESAGAALTWKNQPILKLDEVVGNLSAVEADNFNEISDFKTILPPLPIWKDELYLEFHRGCYTTRADQKRQNRRCEELLYQAELLSSLARICAGAIYPSSELETSWKKVLFNQFHDILPGSAIAQVYIDANLAFAEVDRTCRQILLKSLDAIALQISLPSPPQPDAQPILIFNTLNWSRSEVVSLPLPDSAAENWLVYDLEGQRLVTQIQVCDRPESQFTLLFSANNIPAVGYRVFWLCREAAETPENSSLLPINHKKTELRQVTTTMARNEAFCQETHFEAQRKVLENEFFLAKIDWETGNLSSIWDKINNREVLNVAGGNQLQSFQDSGQYWDAWNIDPNYEKHQLPAPILKDISWIAQGEIRQSLRVVRQIGKSEFCQDYIVEIGSPLLKIRTLVDWQETHVLVKTAFGLNQSADFATCEIPGGAIERTTKPQTATEKAKWEVPILRWVDISNDDFGVSLLNDCKYGCDLQPNQLRLTLLRGSTWPDEQADIGIHEFTYAVYPHSGNWQDAGTVRQGYELNLPLLVKVLPKLEENHHKTLPTVGKLLDLSADNLVLMAFKQSEDNPNLWILRCYESEGKEAVLELDSDLGLAISQPVDLLERPANLSEKLPTGGFKIEPWKIASFAVNL